MMIGWATPTVEPLVGTILGGPNGALPVNGVGSCPAPGPAGIPGSPGAGSASAGPVPSTSTQPNIEATPAAFSAAKRLPLVQPDICPSSHFVETVSHSAQADYFFCRKGGSRRHRGRKKRTPQ